MAEDYRGRALPHRDNPEDSQYPPPPGEEDDRARGYQTQLPSMASTLPPISAYGPPPAGRGYPPPPDPRARGSYSASPTSANGYPPPSAGAYGLPPVQGPDPRGYGRGDYYGQGAYAHDPYNPYGAYRGPPPAGYPGYPDFRMGPGGAQAQPAAPRQRTSIACRYCRKRKIRCSGYQNTPDGKCTNCKKTGNDCVFQPVSSSSSTAFVPVSAVPGGVPPGTPLYGAFGQPLAPASGTGGGPQPAYPPGGGDYQQPPPLQSPTSANPYYGYPDDRAEAGRRRAREDDHGPRLPPPNPYPDEDPRRRSPVSAQSGTPPAFSYPRPEYESDNRTPTPRRHSPGGNAAPGSASTPSSMMSLSNLMDHPPRAPSDANRDIDQNMLGRLNRRP